MILIFLALVAATVISGTLVWFGNQGYDSRHNWAGGMGIMGLCVSSIGLVVYSMATYSWFAAEHKANIINREYGTNYSQIEVFYASDVIETVRQLDRKRYEINGDLVRKADSPSKN